MGPDRATSLNYGIGGSQSTVTPLTRFLIPGIRIHCIIIRKNIDRLLGSIQCRKKRVSDDPISDQANICLSIPGFQSGYGFGSRSGLLVQHWLSQLMVVLLMSVLDPEQLLDRVNRQDLLLPLQIE